MPFEKNPITTLEHFKQKSKEIFPSIEGLPLNNEEWDTLFARFIRDKNTGLTSLALTTYLAALKGLSIEKVEFKLRTKEHLKRDAKQEYIPSSSSSKKRRRQSAGGEAEKTEFVFRSKSLPEQTLLRSPLGKLGGREAEVRTATPKQNKKVCKTPGGTVVRPVYGYKGTTLFTVASPEKLENEQPNLQKIKTDFAKMPDKPVDPVKFTATFKKIRRMGTSRGISQKSIMKVSCASLFDAYQIQTKDEGRHYHWSHLIGHYLGGEQSSANLVAGTADSNYNTLKLIEQPIVDILKQGTVKEIEVTIHPHYQGDEHIPYMLTYDLKWEIDNQEHQETINIYPKSHQRMHNNVKEAMQLIKKQERDVGNWLDADSDVESDTDSDDNMEEKSSRPGKN